MIMHKISLQLISVSTVTLIIMNVFLSTAQASAITQPQINEQQRVVLVEIVDVLEEHLKLLQMQWIQQLEARVTWLQAQLDAQ